MSVIEKILAESDIWKREGVWEPLASAGFGLITSQSGEKISPDKALALGVYFACLRNMSEDLGKLPFITYRRIGPAKERATDHPLYPLLHDSPNDDMTAMAFRETLTHHAAGWGGGFAEISRDGGDRPRALHPIHPSRIKITRDNDGRLIYDVYANELGQPPVHFPQADIFHLHGLGAGGTSGYCLSYLAREAVGLGIAVEKFAARFFKNAARPSGVLRHPGKLSDEAHTHLRESWKTHYAGEGAHNPAILEEGMEWKQITIPPEEAQMLATRQFTVEDVCRWFRMPPHKVQHLLRATFGNIEHQAMEYVTDTLMSWAVRWEQEAKRKLFPDEADIFVEHLFEALLRGDQVKRAMFHRSLWNIGATTHNEIRARENMNPVEGGDTHWVPANMIPLEKALTQDPGQAAAAKMLPARSTVEALRPAIHAEWQRLLRRETKAVCRAVDKYRGDQTAFEAWGTEFFARHQAAVHKSLQPFFVGLTGVVDPSGEADLIKDYLQEACRAAIVAYAAEDLPAWTAERQARAGPLTDQLLQSIRSKESDL